jgi:hypothetical protein
MFGAQRLELSNFNHHTDYQQLLLQTFIYNLHVFQSHGAIRNVSTFGSTLHVKIYHPKNRNVTINPSSRDINTHYSTLKAVFKCLVSLFFVEFHYNYYILKTI